MMAGTLPIWAAAPMMSGAALVYSVHANAQGAAGVPTGSGDRITGTSTGDTPGNRGTSDTSTGATAPASITPDANTGTTHHRHHPSANTSATPNSRTGGY
ncbi:MAG: hypothetical protein WDN03_06675 [Rhizomicrobium sp.]